MMAPSAMKAQAAFDLYDFLTKLATKWAADPKHKIQRKATETTASVVMCWRISVRRYAIIGYDAGKVLISYGHGEQCETEDGFLEFTLAASQWTFMSQLETILITADKLAALDRAAQPKRKRSQS